MANAAIATVVSVVGKAYARNADGELRELRTGDVLVEGETVVTPDGGRVELSMTDGSPLVINDMPETTLTRDLMAETAAGPDESAVQDETIDQVLAALESGEDLGDVLEATAAGASGGEGGEGNSFIRLGRIAEDTSEFSGLLGSDGITSDIPEDENYLGVDAVDDSAETEEGEAVVIDVKDNDIFPEGGSVTLVTQGANGKVTINADNTVTYTPDDGFFGEDEFEYTVVGADGGGSDVATVKVIVIGEPAQLPTISVGDDVVVEGETATVTISLSQISTEDVTVSFNTADGSATILGKDYNANNGTVTIKAGELSTTVSVSTNPDNIEEGSENLLVNLSNPVNATIADGEGEIIITDDYVSPTISINDVTVTEGDLATLTVSLSRAIDEDVTFKFDSADGSATVSGGDYNAATGEVTIPAGTTEVTISAQTNTDNLDEPTEQFTVDLSEVTNATVADGTGVVTIIDDFTPPTTPPTTPPSTPPPVVDPNLPPVAVDDTASTEANTPVDINVLPNDSDPDGDAISITGFTQPTNGSVVQNPDGTFTYTPDSEFSGNDSFTYTITDGEFSSTADVNIFVDDNPVEIADENPLARGIQRVLDEALLTGGTQENPDALKGEGSFDVTSKDGLSSLTVNGEELIDSEGALLQGTIVTDSGEHVQVTFTSMDGPTADGVYTINYEVTLIKPFANDPGSDSVDVDFVIAALDSDGDVAGPVTRSATIQDDNPIANDDTNGIGPDDEGLINGDVFLGDSSGGVADEPGADGAMVTSISFVGEDEIEQEKDVSEAGTIIAGDYGDLTIKSDGTYDYQLNQAGQEAIIALDGQETIEDQFTYVLTDGDTDTDPATLTITLDGRNDPPDAVNDEATTNEDTPVDITVLTNDSDPDGDPLDVTVATDPANGSVVINEDNTLTYTPDENFNGEDTFEYTISDGKGGTDTATVSITVNPAVDFPTTDDKSVSGNEDNDIPITLSGDDSDGTVVKFTINTLPTDGVLKLGGVAVTAGQVIDANGDEEASLTFTPNANWNGDTSFTYASQDNDANNDATPATVSITVNPVNDPPVANDDAESVNKGQTINIDLATNDTDIDGTVNPATIVITGDPSNGSVTVNADGTVDYQHDNSLTSGDSFKYTILDNDGLISNEATVTVTVSNQAPEIDMSLSGMDVDEGHLVIGNDYVDPQTSDPRTTDAGSIGFKTGDQPFTLNIGSATFTSLAAITAANGTTIGTEHGTLTFGGLTGPVDGTYTLAYSYQLDEAEDHSTSDADPGQDRVLVTLVDSDGDNVGDQYITVGIVDDKPVGFDPDSAFVVDGSGVASDIPLNFSNSVGADDLGSVVFSPIAGDNTAKDVNGNILKIEGKPLFFYTSDDGLELTVATANPYDGSFVDGTDLVALTFEIDGDSYTLTSNNGVISNGTDLSNADLSGVRGGNSDQLLLIDAFESSSNSLLDVLASGVGNSDDNTVNSNDFSMGVGAGNDVDFKVTGDVLTLEFVSGLSATDEFGDPETTYDSRIGVNNFKLPLLNVRNEATLTVTLYNGDALPENLVDTLEYNTTTDGLVIPDGVDSKIDNYFTISTEENFTTVVIEATAGNFKVGQFALTEFVEGQPVNLSVGVTGIDADDIVQVGDDSVEATIDVTVQAANDNLVDASSDPLTGTSEDDIFIWELADATSENDVVVGFGAEGNDILDLRDILQLEDSGAPGEIGNLDNYLSVSLEGSNTVIGVSSAGAFTGVAEDVNFIDQTITLQNVDLVSGNGDLEGIIQNMLDSGKLLTD